MGTILRMGVRSKKRISSKGQKAKSKRASKAKPRKVARARPARDLSLCTHCEKKLKSDDRAIFVEEEVGRMFCSENCIVAYFSPEIEKLENEYFRNVLPGDLTPREKDSLSELKWKTLEQPQEVYFERTRSGDKQHTLIAEYEVQGTRVWCVCICLFLRGEPSFLYLSFLTRHGETIDAYRKGHRESVRAKTEATPPEGYPEGYKQKVDRLAEAWTEDESYQAQLVETRSKNDIPPEQFRNFDACIDETLQVPDEVWTLKGKGDRPLDVYHFIRQYPDRAPGVWYVIVARETEDREQIEILDAFPTKDGQLVDRYRKGKQEIGPQNDPSSVSRLIH